jgi:hypothetical protein
MKVSSKKAKGRRLQNRVAEALARYAGLKVAKVGIKEPVERRGVTYVPEDASPDILVRQMGMPGLDIALLTDKAKMELRRALNFQRIPLGIECKNNEALASALLWPFGRVKSEMLFKFILYCCERDAIGCIAANRLEPVLIVPAEWYVLDQTPTGEYARVSIGPKNKAQDVFIVALSVAFSANL